MIDININLNFVDRCWQKSSAPVLSARTVSIVTVWRISQKPLSSDHCFYPNNVMYLIWIVRSFNFIIMLIKADILCFNTERLCDLSLTFDFELRTLWLVTRGRWWEMAWAAWPHADPSELWLQRQWQRPESGCGEVRQDVEVTTLTSMVTICHGMGTERHTSLFSQATTLLIENILSFCVSVFAKI